MYSKDMNRGKEDHKTTTRFIRFVRFLLSAPPLRSIDRLNDRLTVERSNRVVIRSYSGFPFNVAFLRVANERANERVSFEFCLPLAAALNSFALCFVCLSVIVRYLCYFAYEA